MLSGVYRVANQRCIKHHPLVWYMLTLQNNMNRVTAIFFFCTLKSKETYCTGIKKCKADGSVLFKITLTKGMSKCVRGCKMARIKKDCNLKKWSNFTKFYPCMMEKSLKIIKLGSLFEKKNHLTTS